MFVRIGGWKLKSGLFHAQLCQQWQPHPLINSLFSWMLDTEKISPAERPSNQCQAKQPIDLTEYSEPNIWQLHLQFRLLTTSYWHIKTLRMIYSPTHPPLTLRETDTHRCFVGISSVCYLYVLSLSEMVVCYTDRCSSKLNTGWLPWQYGTYHIT